MEKTYQIIWADDEIDALLDENGKELLSKQHVDVIKCNNAAMLEEKLKNVCYRIDAVIVDANFTARDFTPSDETIVSGLRKAMMLIGEYGHSPIKHLPFYLYTQRVNLSDLVEEDELNYFKDNNAIFFKKNGLLPLLDRIKNDVDKNNSAEFQIDNQFKKELNYFQIFDKQCNAKSHNIIRELLIQSREGLLSGTEDYFNKFRSEILENMKAVAIHFGIAPVGLSLNDFSRFLCLQEVEVKEVKYKLKKEVLPRALYLLMGHVVMMVQDGSHKRDIRYGVHQFVSENKDTLIIQSLLFAIIEIISWFIPYLASHTDKQKNLTNWKIQD
jgi:hypothetical protein